MAFFGQTKKQTKEAEGNWWSKGIIGTLVGAAAGAATGAWGGPGTAAAGAIKGAAITGAVSGATPALAGGLGEALMGPQEIEYETKKGISPSQTHGVGFGSQTSQYMAQLSQQPPQAPQPLLPGYMTQKYY